MRRMTAALLAASLVACLVLVGSPSPCSACTPSGGPGEVLLLHLNSVETDVSAATGDPVYSATDVKIQGVEATLTLYLRVGDVNVAVDFVK